MRLYNQLDRWSLRAATHVVTVCEPFRRTVEARGVDSERISVHHNPILPFAPIDEEAVGRVRQSLSCQPGTPVLLMVSRLSHEKGHLDFLAAMAILKQQGVRCHALIVGEGPERGAIEKTIKRLDLTANVTLAGHQNDVRPYYASATLYLMPSHSEGSPLALLEALTAGVPVIASRAGGIPEIVSDGSTGLLTPRRDPTSLAGAVGRLLRDPDLANALAENAVRDTARFSPYAYHRDLVEVYGRALFKFGLGPMTRNAWSRRPSYWLSGAREGVKKS